MKDKFCKIHVSSKVTKNEIEDVLEKTNVLNYLENKVITFINKNEEYEKTKERDFPDGFLFFKYSIDLDFAESEKKSNCINYINFILQLFWSNKVPAVASCDYENLLLKKGGYNSEEIFNA